MKAEREGGDAAGVAPVGGVILSAGRSIRMGEPKALLGLDGRTFVAAALAALREGGCSEVVIVVAGARVADAADDAASGLAAEATNEAARPAVAGRVTVVRNLAQGSEQRDSLLAGLRALSRQVEAAVVLPVDHPLVRAETVSALIRAGRSNPGAIIRPTLGREPGHPTIFPRTLWPRLKDPALSRGARSLVESPETRTVDVPVDDPGILADIDTPADYRRWVVDGVQSRVVGGPGPADRLAADR